MNIDIAATMKRKPDDPPNQLVNSSKELERKTRRKQNNGKFCQVKSNQNRNANSSFDVPLPSVFKRFYGDLGHDPIHTVPISANQGKLITPCTPRNNSTCFKGRGINHDNYTMIIF